MDELATLTQEITTKVRTECMEMMNVQLQGIYRHLEQMGVSLPRGELPSPNTIKSSCQSVNPQEQFSDISGPTPCRLWVNDEAKGRVYVARGAVFPSNTQGENMIHNTPIACDNVRVSVDDIVPELQLTPLPVPCDEHENVGSAAGSFVQWPKAVVTKGQDPISLEKKTGHEVGKLSKNVESKGSVTPLKPTFPLLKPAPPTLKQASPHFKQAPPPTLNETISSEHCQSLKFLLNKRSSSTRDLVFKFQESGESPIYVGPEDIHQFMKMSWLYISILEIFVKQEYVETMCKELSDERFAFMLPSRLVIHNKRDYQCSSEACDYLTHSLVTNKDKHFIIAPYIQDDHWMLLLFCLKEGVIYVFDSLRTKRDLRLKGPLQTAFKLYTSNGGLRNNRDKFLILHTEVQCPQQQGGTECGFFVMRNMFDIVKRSQKTPQINWKAALGSRSYSKKEINEVQELWAKFFIQACM